MIRIKRYRQMGNYVEVFLDCDCGEASIVEKTEEGEKIFVCQTCNGQTSSRSLRNEATPFTRGSEWLINIDKRAAKRMAINIPVRIDCIAPHEDLPLWPGAAAQQQGPSAAPTTRRRKEPPHAPRRGRVRPGRGTSAAAGHPERARLSRRTQRVDGRCGRRRGHDYPH